jgi:hypothetical protein
MHVVVGKPIEVDKNTQPTIDEVGSEMFLHRLMIILVLHHSANQYKNIET